MCLFPFMYRRNKFLPQSGFYQFTSERDSIRIWFYPIYHEHWTCTVPTNKVFPLKTGVSLYEHGFSHFLANVLFPIFTKTSFYRQDKKKNTESYTYSTRFQLIQLLFTCFYSIGKTRSKTPKAIPIQLDSNWYSCCFFACSSKKTAMWDSWSKIKYKQ